MNVNNGGKKMIFQNVLITPEVASDMLSRNANNRPLTNSLVGFYAKQMMSGNWQSNGETIKISRSNNLLDGQHRLSAIVKYGKPVLISVAFDVDDDSFKTIDTGKKRVAAQIVAMSGFLNASAVAAGARWINAIKNRTGTSPGSVSSQEILDLIEKHPFIKHYASLMKNSKLLISSLSIAVFALAAEKYGQEKIDSFVLNFRNGANLSKNMPIYELRERLIAAQSKQMRLTPVAVAAMTVKAVKAYCENKLIKSLRYAADEEFPEI